MAQLLKLSEAEGFYADPRADTHAIFEPFLQATDLKGIFKFVWEKSKSNVNFPDSPLESPRSNPKTGNCLKINMGVNY